MRSNEKLIHMLILSQLEFGHVECLDCTHTWRMRDAVGMAVSPHIRHTLGGPPLPLGSLSRIARSTYMLILALAQYVRFGPVECLGLRVRGVCVMPRGWQSCHTCGTTRESHHCHRHRFHLSRGSFTLSKSNLHICLNLALQRLCSVVQADSAFMYG